MRLREGCRRALVGWQFPRVETLCRWNDCVCRNASTRALWYCRGICLSPQKKSARSVKVVLFSTVSLCVLLAGMVAQVRSQLRSQPAQQGRCFSFRTPGCRRSRMPGAAKLKARSSPWLFRTRCRYNYQLRSASVLEKAIEMQSTSVRPQKRAYDTTPSRFD